MARRRSSGYSRGLLGKRSSSSGTTRITGVGNTKWKTTPPMPTPRGGYGGAGRSNYMSGMPTPGR